ncbi:MAG: ROK family protein [Armatimonadetes bacterium]|nr:ROK family protein [Armatimonadota bacterium]MDW8121138.1 ROK family protein [Armatimonadota bacterium]
MRREELIGFVGVDIGGQSTRVGIFDQRGRLKVISFPTEGNFRTECEAIVTAIKKLNVDRVRRIGVGSPGPLDWKKRLVYDTPNLPWRKVNFGLLEEMSGWSVLLDNDANVAGLGEATMGRGRGKRFIAGFTLGTGIGHFQVKDGRIYHGRLDVEAGHQILDPQGPKCNCGQRGCLEAFVSAVAIERRYGKPPHLLNDPKAWKEIAYRLAQGLVNVAVHTSPDVLILTGGMLARGRLLFDPLRRYYEAMLKVYPPAYRPPVLAAQLGDKAGVVGAIVLAKVGHSD